MNRRILPIRIDSLQVPRAGEAQREFSQAHGDAIAAEFDMSKFGYPVVNQVDETNWVVDGQHRVYGLRRQPAATRGTTVECEVYENLSKREMADLFLGRNRSRNVNGFERFTVAVTAGHARERAIMRIVTAAKLEIKKDQRKRCIFAVGALQRVFEREGPGILERVMVTLREAYDGAPNAFGGAAVEGLALVFARYGVLRCADGPPESTAGPVFPSVGHRLFRRVVLRAGDRRRSSNAPPLRTPATPASRPGPRRRLDLPRTRTLRATAECRGLVDETSSSPCPRSCFDLCRALSPPGRLPKPPSPAPGDSVYRLWQRLRALNRVSCYYDEDDGERQIVDAERGFADCGRTR